MSDADSTLNTMLDTFRGVIIALATGSNADMGKVADSLAAMSTSPQFEPNAKLMLAQLGKEMSTLREE